MMPTPEICPFCGTGPISDNLTTYQLPEREPLVVCDQLVPGLKCADPQIGCGAQYYEPEVASVLFKATVPLLEEIGEMRLASMLRKRVENLEGSLDRPSKYKVPPLRLAKLTLLSPIL